MKSKLKIFQRFLILIVLCFGVGFILSTEQPGASASQMYECCENCPGGGDPASANFYCYDVCNGDYYCMQSCEQNAFQCYSNCAICELGCGFDCPVGGGGVCYTDTQCPPGWRCEGRSCYLETRQCYVNSQCNPGQVCSSGLCI